MVLDNYSITSALSSIAGQYDQVSRYNSSLLRFEHFVNDATYDQFTAFEAGKGYQIYVTNPSGCTLRVTGRVSSSPISVSLPSGWQMIGYPSKTRIKVSDALAGLVKGANYDRISKYNKATNTFTDLALTDYLEAGQAYFIHMLKASTWVIPASMATNVTTFTYDADGSRVKKALNGTATVYIDELYEATGSLTTKHIYLGANRIASKTSFDTLYYHSDHLGSSNVVTNSTGAQVQLSEYKPFGELKQGLPPQGSVPINYLFTGKELDTTSLYYYGARYYDPKIGRFISADPIDYSDEGIKAVGGKDLKTFLRNPQNLNRYSYCLNNPLRYIDPSGYYSCEDLSKSFDNLLYNFNQSINWASYNIIQPINNTFYSPGSNYGEWIYGEKNLKNFYGACLDSVSLIANVEGAWNIGKFAYYNITGSTFCRYIGNKSLSLGKGSWVTRGSEAPYGTNFELAMKKLSGNPNNPWSAVESFDVSWNQYVGGPRSVAPKVLWGQPGKGMEYRIGGFRDWGEYFSDWATYIGSFIRDSFGG